MKFLIISFCTCFLFLCVGYFVLNQSHDAAIAPVARLDSMINKIDGWSGGRQHDVDRIIIDALDLDDYVNQAFRRGDDQLTLYIGYYHSASKVGAAHDPMVCFPGQGWNVNKGRKGTVNIEGIDNEVSYRIFIAKLGEQQQLVLYWFQAYDEACDSTLMQKITLAKKKLLGKGESNAFVRITTPCSDNRVEECKSLAIDFVKSFYPPFLDYITQSN